MKILKTKAKRDVTVALVEEVAEGLVYDLVCGNHTHRVTVGLSSTANDPMASLQSCAENHAIEVIEYDANKQLLANSGLDTVPPPIKIEKPMLSADKNKT